MRVGLVLAGVLAASSTALAASYHNEPPHLHLFPAHSTHNVAAVPAEVTTSVV